MTMSDPVNRSNDMLVVKIGGGASLDLEDVVVRAWWHLTPRFAVAP